MQEKIDQILSSYFTNDIRLDINDIIQQSEILDMLRNINIEDIIDYVNQKNSNITDEIIYESVNFTLYYYGLEDEYTCYTSRRELKISDLIKNREYFILDFLRN